MDSKEQMRASVAVTGDFTAEEVLRIVSVVMTGETYVYNQDKHRRYHGKIAVELAEIIDPVGGEKSDTPVVDHRDSAMVYAPKQEIPN